MTDLPITVFQEPQTSDLPLPAYATQGASGMDLHAALTDELRLSPGERAIVPTGIHIAVPKNYEAQVRPRSGLAARHGLSMVNTPGTIDSDYTGEIRVILINLGSEPIILKRGDRIAQLVFAPVTRIAWRISNRDLLPESVRGEGGFGHTGLEPLEATE